MKEINTGGPAFPRALEVAMTADLGMTLRDYFAAAALEGYLASYPPGELIRPNMAAISAYELADAMLEERQK